MRSAGISLELQPGGLSLAVVDGGQRVERALLHGFSCQVQCVTARQVGAVSRQSIGLLSGNPPGLLPLLICLVISCIDSVAGGLLLSVSVRIRQRGVSAACLDLAVSAETASNCGYGRRGWREPSQR